MNRIEIEKMSIADELFQVLVEAAIDELSQMFNKTPVHVMALLMNWAGGRTACLAYLMEENPEIRAKLLIPGMEHHFNRADVKEMALANFEHRYEIHAKVLEENGAHAKEMADKFIKAMCESHKKGSDK